MTDERRDQAEQGEGFVGHTDVENQGEQAQPPAPQHVDDPEAEQQQADEEARQSQQAEQPWEDQQEQRVGEQEGSRFDQDHQEDNVVQGQPEEEVDNADSTSRAQSQVQAQDQANANYELEFENRVAPLRDEIQTYRDDLANQGDEAGAAHASHFLDMIIQRFRLPGDTSSPENQEQ